MDFKRDGLPDPTDVYAEFTSGALAVHYSCEQQAESYYMPATDPGPGSESAYVASDQCHYAGSSDSTMSQGQAEGQEHCQRSQYDGQQEVQPQRGDHAQYVPEEYLHFYLER